MVSSAVEPAQRAAQRDALLELAEFRRFQLAVQFLLAGQDDLQQLAAAVLQIPEQPDFLQNIPFQIVRLVHDQHRSAPGAGPLQQHVVQREQHFGLGEAVARRSRS